MSDISIECYECGAVYEIEEDYNSGSTRVVKVVPHKCDGDMSSVVSELKEQMSEIYNADFLWPCKDGSVEEAGYEFANATTEEYRKHWWGVLLDRARSQIIDLGSCSSCGETVEFGGMEEHNKVCPEKGKDSEKE